MASIEQRGGISRFTDIRDEPVDRLLSPIKRYQEVPLVSLTEAIEPVASLFHEVADNIFVALNNCRKPADDLTQQESAAIHLYTMSFDGGPNLYVVLNEALRAEDREELTLWQSFLKLFLTALYKLPSESGTVWRGVKGSDLISKYNVGTKFAWWGVASCTRNVEVLETKSSFGRQGKRTLFCIECMNGKAISKHSYYKSAEQEVILMPGSYFEVMETSTLSPDVTVIKLKEITSPITLIKAPISESKISESFPATITSDLFPSPVLVPGCPLSSEVKVLRKKLSNNTEMGESLTDIKWINKHITVAGGQGYGSGINQLKAPLGICFDSDEESLIIADGFNHRVIEWKIGSTTGKVVAGGKGQGGKLEQLDTPTDVLIEKETNSLIIADSGNQRIVRWPRQNGATQGEILLSNIHCYGVALDNRGFLYVSDVGKHEVRRYVTGVGVMKGTVVAGGHGRGSDKAHLNEPSFIFVDQHQSVYISDKGNHRVMKWFYGAVEGIVVAGGEGQGNELNQLSNPNGLYVDRFETICVVDTGNSRVMRWEKGAEQGTIAVDGSVQREGMSLLKGPTGVAIDRKLNLYIADGGNGRVQRFPLA